MKPSSEQYSKLRPAKAERWMFMAGAYQPETSISSAIWPMERPNSLARSTFQAAAITTPAGKPMVANVNFYLCARESDRALFEALC